MQRPAAEGPYDQADGVRGGPDPAVLAEQQEKAVAQAALAAAKTKEIHDTMENLMAQMNKCWAEACEWSKDKNL